MGILHQDLKFAVRVLIKSPTFTLVAALTLALGIGACTALFSIVNGVLLNPLPYPHSGELVALYVKTQGFDQSPISYPNFLDWQRGTHSFSSIAMYHNEDYNLTGKGEAERVTGQMISADFFHILGISPILGRMFGPKDDQVGAAPVVILSGGFWKRKFASSSRIIGESLTLNGIAYTIVGVMPPELTFYGTQRDIYTPLGQWNDPSFRDRRVVFSSGMIGRLNPGTTLSEAQADMENVAQNLAAAYPDADKGVDAVIISMKQDITGNVKPFLLVLMFAVAFLLLIACVNVANLLLARSVSRSREFAVRSALGASKKRIFRQLLTESVLLAGLGGSLGLVIAYWATKIMLDALPRVLPRSSEIHLDSRVLFFTLVVSLLSGIFFGLGPASKALRSNLYATLKEGSRGSTGVHLQLQNYFIVAEIAMALVLLVGAGLMIRTLAALWRVNPGFTPHHAITFNVSLPSTPNTNAAETRARLRQFDDSLGEIAGVEAVSVTLGSRPMIHPSTEAFWIEGQPKPAMINDMNQALFTFAEPGFQRAMGISLERGRFLAPQDNEHSPIAIVIDDVFAHKYFPNADPIGKHVNLAMFGVQAEIVGVVAHVRQWGVDTDSPSAIEAEFYYPFLQIPQKLMPIVASAVGVVLRTQGNPAAVMSTVRRVVTENEPGDVIYNVETMDEVISNSFAARRVTMILLGIFAALALALSCVGIFGVVSYIVGQRTNEIGVRMALGAQRGDILRLILGKGALMAFLGVTGGTLIAFILTRLMNHELFGVSPHDPLTFIGVALLLFGIAIAACYFPAARAMRIDPAIALRVE